MKNQTFPKVAILSGSLSDVTGIVLMLAARYTMTLSSRVGDLEGVLTESFYPVILIGLTPDATNSLATVKTVIDASPESAIILLNGKLNQKKIIALFKMGIFDYFASPVDEKLVIERTEKVLHDMAGRQDRKSAQFSTST